MVFFCANPTKKKVICYYITIEIKKESLNKILLRKEPIMATKTNKDEELNIDELETEIKEELQNNDSQEDEESQEDKNEETESKKQKKEELSPVEYGTDFLLENFDFHMSEDGTFYYSEKGEYYVEKVSIKANSPLMLAVQSYAKPRDVLSEQVAKIAIYQVQDAVKKKIQYGEKESVIIEPRVLEDEDTGDVYLDTMSSSGVIRITSVDWEENAEVPEYLRFFRSSITGSMKIEDFEINEANYNELFKHLNIPNDMRNAVLAWAISRWVSPNSASPLLTVVGYAGSGKTTTAVRLQQLIDPMAAMGAHEAILGLPETPEEMDMRTIGSSCVLYDNVSSISLKISNLMCRISTGGGSIKRQLFTDQGLVINSYMRSQIMTAVELPIMRHDLQTRSIFVQPKKITGKYQSERELRKDWNSHIAKFRGFLLNLACEVKQCIEDNNYSATARLSDYSIVVQAVDDVISNNTNTTIDSLVAIANATQNQALEAVPDIVDFMINNDEIIYLEGGAKDVLTEIQRKAENNNVSTKTWGDTGKWMGSIINDHMTVLDRYFEIRSVKRHGKKYYYMDKKEGIINTDVDDYSEFLK